MVIIGAIQIAVGYAMCYYSGGLLASFGSKLIMEGAKDIMKTIY